MKIKCSNCGKEIEKKGIRTLCIHCRNLLDKVKVYQRNKSEDYKKYQESYRKAKRGV